jgi:hypothetical protein
MIKNIKIHNIFYIIELSKSKNFYVFIKKNMKMFIYVSLMILKVRSTWENQGVTFLMIPPKYGFAH